MQGQIDTSFQTLQRDLFTSGLAADIGMNAFGVWLAIKNHADFNTGQAWPGMRRLAELTGLSLAMVHKCVKRLVEHRLLRVLHVAKGRGRRGSTYVARERLDVRLGNRVVCSVIVDYVPATIRTLLNDMQSGIRSDKPLSEVFAQCEILPGSGFAWDESSKSLRGAVDVKDLPLPDLSEEKLKAPVMQKLLEMQAKAKAGHRG